MYGRILCFILCAIFSATGATAMSQQGCSGSCVSCHSMSVKEANEILLGVGEVKSVKMAPVGGLYELELTNNGRQGTVYMDFGKKHLVPAPIFSIATRRPVAVETAVQGPRLTRVDIATVPTENSVVMGNPKGKSKLFVFTDPDCPYCAKLHAEMLKLIALEPDLAIYVKMYPLKMHPQAYDKARVILGGGSAELLNKAFAGEPLPVPGSNEPGKPVDETMRYAASIGVDSTPTMILPNGRIVTGFRDLAALRKELADDQTTKISSRAN